jgi:hypothetical protein
MKIRDIIIESKTVKVEPQKPRNFVAKNAASTTTGAGAHKDKKRAEKQGDVKHKKQAVPMESLVNEMYDREFEVDGWTYMTYLELEDDNRKLYHMAKDPQGQEHDIHYTPYARLTPKLFKLWVKLGAPKNLSKFGSFNKDDIIQAAEVKGIVKLDPEMARAGMEDAVDEGPASRALCTSGKPDSALGASNLASCKSQGYRSRDGGKSHKVGSERVKVRGKKIKGKKYGGPLPDWS